MKLAVHGASGRMGRAIVRLGAADAGIELVGAAGRPGSDAIDQDVGVLAGVGHVGVAIQADVASACLGADVLVDFSLASAFRGALEAARKAGVAFVSGTTRLSEADEAAMERAAGEIPVLWAPNTSLGVQVVGQLVETAVRQLGGYDIEIVEAHHRRKVDAPSGTAMFLLQSAQRARPGARAVHGREGVTGERGDEIGVHALRGGGVVGDHTVHVIGEHERVSITHQAISRDLFAAGALAAARFVVGRPAGRYDMASVLTAS